VDKQQQLEGMCAELEAANAKRNSRQVFQIVKSMTRKFLPCLQCIQSATGKNLTEAAQIADRWKGYCEDLYHDEEANGTEQEYWEKEPPLLHSDVARAIRQTASRKATGPDDVSAELFKAGGETALDRMHGICVAIWETGKWPEEWTFSTFIPLPRKGDFRQCENYKTVALVSHASKILLQIIVERIRVKTETEIAAEQAGFQQSRGTRDQITNPRTLMHKAHEHQQPHHSMCSSWTSKKAFDPISHDKLWVTHYDGHWISSALD